MSKLTIQPYCIKFSIFFSVNRDFILKPSEKLANLSSACSAGSQTCGRHLLWKQWAGNLGLCAFIVMCAFILQEKEASKNYKGEKKKNQPRVFLHGRMGLSSGIPAWLAGFWELCACNSSQMQITVNFSSNKLFSKLSLSCSLGESATYLWNVSWPSQYCRMITEMGILCSLEYCSVAW